MLEVGVGVYPLKQPQLLISTKNLSLMKQEHVRAERHSELPLDRLIILPIA